MQNKNGLALSMIKIEALKPGSYFMRMRYEFDVTTRCHNICRCDITSKRVEHNSTDANYLLQKCDVNIRITFAFAGSMNRALLFQCQGLTLMIYFMYSESAIVTHVHATVCFMNSKSVVNRTYITTHNIGLHVITHATDNIVLYIHFNTDLW